VALGVLGVAVALGLMLLVAWLGSRGDVELTFGGDRFEVGRTDRLSAEIAERGPFLFADASPNRSRDVYIQHLGGDDPDEGWVAIGARAPDQADRTCFLRPEDDGFVDPCSGERYPADGSGLTRYPTEVEDGRVFVDFRSTTEGSPRPASG